MPSPRPQPLTLLETARRLSAYRWIEERTFETLGAWAALVPERDVQRCLAVHAPKHAWHAELWGDRMPRAAAVDADVLAHGPSDAATALFDAICAAPGEGQTVDKLVGVYRVLLPRKIAAYRDHLQMASAVADGALIRSLRHAVADELDDWQEGERLLQALLTTPESVKRAAARQAHFESLIVGGLMSDRIVVGGQQP